MTAASAKASWRLWVVKVDSRGRITLPAEVRQRLGVKAGDTLVLVLEKQGLRIETAAGPLQPRRGE